jgi:hypothetical protein
LPCAASHPESTNSRNSAPLAPCPHRTSTMVRVSHSRGRCFDQNGIRSTRLREFHRLAGLSRGYSSKQVEAPAMPSCCYSSILRVPSPKEKRRNKR